MVKYWSVAVGWLDEGSPWSASLRVVSGAIRVSGREGAGHLGTTWARVTVSEYCRLVIVIPFCRILCPDPLRAADTEGEPDEPTAVPTLHRRAGVRAECGAPTRPRPRVGRPPRRRP